MVYFRVFLGLVTAFSHLAFTAESLERVYLRLTVIMSDSEGDRLVPGLKREDFQVFNRGVPQFIEYFSAAPSPSSVTILLDTNGSMQSIDLNRTIDDLIDVCNVQSVPDEISLIAFSNKSTMLKSFAWRVRNVDFREVLRLLEGRGSYGETGMLRALSLAREKIRSQARNHNQAVILITDAEEDLSYSATVELQNQISRMGLRVYGIFFPGENRLDHGRLHDLVVLTGGRYFRVSEPGPLKLIVRWILHELRYQYVIGFAPNSNPLQDQESRISVRLSNAGPESGLSVRFTSATATGRTRRGEEGS
jgi:VWFA-related protein